jgi:hypothetical protein
MNKKIITPAIIVVVILLVGIGGYFLILNNSRCLDGSVTWYFDKQFMSNSESEIFNRTVATSNSCAKTKYLIRENDSMRKVNASEFKNFLQKYNSNCKNCLIYTFRSRGQNEGYYDYATNQLISNSNPTVETVFQFDKPFTISGTPMPETNFPPRYTSNEILEKSLVTVRAVQFWSNACDRGTMPSDTCPFKNEQLVRISFSVAESEGASWHVKEHYFTDKTLKIQNYEGYQLEVLSIDSQAKQATIAIRKVQ